MKPKYRAPKNKRPKVKRKHRKAQEGEFADDDIIIGPGKDAEKSK